MSEGSRQGFSVPRGWQGGLPTYWTIGFYSGQGLLFMAVPNPRPACMCGAAAMRGPHTGHSVPLLQWSVVVECSQPGPGSPLEEGGSKGCDSEPHEGGIDLPHGGQCQHDLAAVLGVPLQGVALQVHCLQAPCTLQLVQITPALQEVVIHLWDRHTLAKWAGAVLGALAPSRPTYQVPCCILGLLLPLWGRAEPPTPFLVQTRSHWQPGAPTCFLMKPSKLQAVGAIAASICLLVSVSRTLPRH